MRQVEAKLLHSWQKVRIRFIWYADAYVPDVEAIAGSKILQVPMHCTNVKCHDQLITRLVRRCVYDYTRKL